MRTPTVVFAGLVILLLAGCTQVGADADAPSKSTPRPSDAGASGSVSASPTPSATSDPTPDSSPNDADLADFATQMQFIGDGLDFDSVDGNVHCGVWSDYPIISTDGTTHTAVVGCRPQIANYETNPSESAGGEAHCSGGRMFGDLAPQPVCSRSAEFAGETGVEVESLPVGTRLTFAGFECTSLTNADIRCVRIADGSGFEVGRDSYRYF